MRYGTGYGRIKEKGGKRCATSFLALVIFSAALLFFSAPVKASGRTDGVVSGKSVFLHPSGVAFWGWQEEVWSGLTDESGNIYDYLREGSNAVKDTDSGGGRQLFIFGYA